MDFQMKEKFQYKRCKLELVPHVTVKAVERNFPISRIKEMLFSAKWGPHILEDRRTCIFKNDLKYWTLIIAITECHLFIITVYESSFSEIRQYKHWGKK